VSGVLSVSEPPPGRGTRVGSGGGGGGGGGGGREDSGGRVPDCRMIWSAVLRGLTWIYRKARGKVTWECAVACWVGSVLPDFTFF